MDQIILKVNSACDNARSHYLDLSPTMLLSIFSRVRLMTPFGHLFVGTAII